MLSVSSPDSGSQCSVGEWCSEDSAGAQVENGCLVSRRQNRSDGPLALFVGYIGDIGDGTRERKRGNRSIGICVLLISTISLMMQYPCRALIYYGIMGAEFRRGWRAFRQTPQPMREYSGYSNRSQRPSKTPG